MKHYVSLLGMFMIASALVFSACGGSGGENGSNGENGYSVLINQSELAPGAECSAGGVQIDIGFDTNGNGVLDADEITNTEYVCNGDDLADYDPGTEEIFTADSVSFSMKYVPGSITFPTGTDDSGEVKVYFPYWIGETEVTYELWYTVHNWAITDVGGGKRVDGGDLYYFANQGREGSNGTIGAMPTNQEPVTTVNWRDAMVWCNALTEWYNVQTGTNFICVYTYAGSIVRDSQDTNATACDNVVETSGTGFRLLSSNEWELAARWREDSTNTVSGYSNPWFTQGDSASGATTYYNDNTNGSGEPGKTANDLVAVYGDYWDGDSWESTGVTGTAVVKSKTDGFNALGLYDMSGNVWEWCFTKSESDRVRRGGSWSGYAVSLRVGRWGDDGPDIENSYIGFRFARTQ